MVAFEDDIVTWYMWGKPLPWICREYERRHGQPLALSDLGDILARRGARRRYARFGSLVPWLLRFDHERDPVYLMLTAEARRREGVALAPDVEARLDGWLSALRDSGLVVDYSFKDGWDLVPRRDGIDFDIIREPPPMPV